MPNYVPYHMHTQLSLLDSCAKYQEYVDKAQECGMTALAFSEHGNIFEYYHKKIAIENAGMKYIHACECYLTETLEEKVRDNYHVWLGARNYEGFLELNELISHSFNRQDGHYYYKPRITWEELKNTSENIIITSACIASPLSVGTDSIKCLFLNFICKNKDRCFLEIQHHNTAAQKEYNKYIQSLCFKFGLKPIAGTDTHALNDREVKGRDMLLKSKNIEFDDNEAGWDLTFKTYDELINAYEIQDVLPTAFIKTAIDNTNELAEMVEPFELDKHTKYPHIYDNPVETYKQKINEGYKSHKYVRERYSVEEVKQTVKEELDVYEKTKSIDFMLLQTYLREWERSQGIQCGYGRGSVSGSFICYLLRITEMDSKKFNLNFFRFMNPSRVTNADIDTDYGEEDRAKVKYFLLHDHLNLPQIQCAEIITFNTIALKGAVRDVCRGLYSDSNTDYIKLSEEIISATEIDEAEARKKYPAVFEYVDILNGTVVSVGSHPSGVLVTDIDIAKQIGVCSLATSEYPVSMLNMKELDDLMYVKLDILGLDNIKIINDTCKMLGIERLTPDNTDLEDEKVWKSIRDDTTMVFQWESASAQAYLRKFMSDAIIKLAKTVNPNFSYIKWFSFGNGLIRPGCASFRDNVANGEILTTGFKELDDFLSATFGRITMQEDIMRFLVKFCGYNDAESDTVRRGIAKKYGTEKFIDEIHDRFISYSHSTYGIDEEKLEEIFPPIKQGILDATRYAFSWNHSDSYSCIGYICGYLRYYYPLEFLTAALNTFKDKEEKTLAITQYANKNNIKIASPKFRHSSGEYKIDKEQNAIYKGIASIKYLNAQIADELYALKDNKYDTFNDLLIDISNTSIDNRQLDILVKIGFFSEFGEINVLLKQIEYFNLIYSRKTFKVADIQSGKYDIPEYLIAKYSGKHTEKTYSQIDSKGLLNELVKVIDYPKTTIADKMRYSYEGLGYIDIVEPKAPDNIYYVENVSGKYTKKYLTLYKLRTGETMIIKAEITLALKGGEIIKINEITNKFKYRVVGEDPTTHKKLFEKTGEKEDVITSYEIVKNA